MKRLFMLTASLLVVAAPAYAWDYNQYGGGQQIGDNATGTQNNVTQRQSQSSQSNSAASAAGGSARSSAQGGRGGSVNNTVVSGGGPVGAGVALTVPGGYGNAPCGGGIGLGGLGLGGGGSGGGTLWEFSDCKRMRESAALRDLGYPDAALAELCQIDRVRLAFGGACPSGRRPEIIVEVLPPLQEKHWATVPCHMPRYRDAAGHCVSPVAPKPKPVLSCRELIADAVRECEERR